MTEANSPYFAAGLEDGTRDAEFESACPPQAPWGMEPSLAWSVMYRRGYDRGHVVTPCECDKSCERRAG